MAQSHQRLCRKIFRILFRLCLPLVIEMNNSRWQSKCFGKEGEGRLFTKKFLVRVRAKKTSSFKKMTLLLQLNQKF